MSKTSIDSYVEGRIRQLNRHLGKALAREVTERRVARMSQHAGSPAYYTLLRAGKITEDDPPMSIRTIFKIEAILGIRLIEFGDSWRFGNGRVPSFIDGPMDKLGSPLAEIKNRETTE